MKVAVVGHVEWCHFLRVDSVPKPGEIIAAVESWHEAAGGGGVSAVQLARHADTCVLFTAVGEDETADRVREQLANFGVQVHASVVDSEPTKEAIVYIDKDKERTITTYGKLKPSGEDKSLPWDELANMDAVYFVSGDAAALQAARKARVLVSTARVTPTIVEAGVLLDALVMSSDDRGEQYAGDTSSVSGLVVRTEGSRGGGTESGLVYEAQPVSADDMQDTYGCGDSFAAGLTFALGQGKEAADALYVAAEWGADAARRRGAHG